MAKRMREKALARAENADRRPQATVKFVRISPSKVRIVLDIIRGKDYNEAMAILQGTPKAASEILIKLLASAGANAEFKNYSKDDLYIAEAFANEGPTYKRWWPRSHGSADQILKRTSHITIILDEKKLGLTEVRKSTKQAKAATTTIDVAEEAKEQVKDDVVKAKETAAKAPAKKSTKATTAAKKPAATKSTATKTVAKTTTKKATTTKGGAK